MNRPLVWAACAFAFGIWCAGNQTLSPYWAVLPGVVFLIVWWRFRSLPYRDGLMIAVVFFVLGAGLERAQWPARLGDPLSVDNRKHPERVYLLEGTVAAAPIYGPGMDYMTVRLRVDRVWMAGGETPLWGGVAVRWSQPSYPVHPGERIRVEGRLDPVLGDVNLGLRGVEDFYRTHRYHSVLRARGDAVTVLRRPIVSASYWASRLRQWESDVLSRAAPVDTQPFLRAVWLGDRAAYTDAAYRPFVETGLAHILSVSGVHVGIVYLSLQWLLRSLVRNRKRRAAITLTAVILFALIAGGRAPILRASLMVGLYLCADLLEREPDAPTALAIAALVFLGLNPGLLWDTGFSLSFTSLASILLFSEVLDERFEILPRIPRQSIATALGVSILPLPLSAQIFHVIPLVGPLCNLLAIPLLGAVLWLCMLTVIAGTVSVNVAGLFGHAAVPLVGLIRWLAQTAAALPYSHLTVTSPTVLAAACYLTAALGLVQWLHARPHARRWLSAAIIGLACAVLFWRPLARPATLDFVDVGHGDATFVRTPGGTTLLVDAGNESEYLRAGTGTVVPWLLAQGISRLDYVAVTHPDQDHIGGVPAVLDAMDVGEVLLWPDPGNSPLETALIRRCNDYGIPVRRVQAGEPLSAADATIFVLHPPAGCDLSGENNKSLVFYVAWSGISALLTGDIELEAESALLDTIPPVDILKVPHHGSHTSSSAAFLSAVSPQIAVISTRGTARREPVGRGVLPRYEHQGVAVYRTDYGGGIRIRQQNGKLTVETARGVRGYTLAPGGN